MPWKLAEGQDEGSQDVDQQGHCFVNVTVSGLKVSTLVEIDATHSFVSNRTKTTLHSKPEFSGSALKVVKSMQ